MRPFAFPCSARYTVDYKWKIIQTAYEEGDYNARASWHYVFYPTLLILITTIGIGFPLAIFAGMYMALGS